MDVSRFMNHHVEILRAIKEMRDRSKAGVATHAKDIAHIIMRMHSKVSLHLATENKVMYPAIYALQDHELSQMAHGFQDEMDGLAKAFDAFCHRWRSAGALANDPEGFRADANTVMKALHQRIQRENTIFYPRLSELA